MIENVKHIRTCQPQFFYFDYLGIPLFVKILIFRK